MNKRSKHVTTGSYTPFSQERLEDSIDALFALPLAEFTPARNALAAELKRAGRRTEADRVKGLTKPSSSAWAVNQLYFRHREPFDRLLTAGERVRQAQALQLAGKAADTRGTLEGRREALSELSRLAAESLQEAGHTPAPDTMRRVVTTLEALSAHAPQADSPRPGRLTADLDPPGFDSLGALLTDAGPGRAGEADPKPIDVDDPDQYRMDQATVALERAEESLREARDKAKTAAAAVERANVQLREAERLKRETEERFKEASAAVEEGVERTLKLKREAEQAGKATEDAEKAVEEATRRLRSMTSKPAGGR